jgi:O-antigen/teichoic acid export membrane protein
VPSTIQFDNEVCTEIEQERASTPDSLAVLTRVLNRFSSDNGKSRGTVRYLRIALNGFTSIAAKAGTLAITVVVSPMAYRYLGPEQFGLWMTMTSFVLFTTFADLGIGNGLALRIAEANGKEDQQYAAKQVSCAFFLLCAIGLLFTLAAFASYGLVNWTRFYGLTGGSVGRIAGISTLILMLCTAMNMPLGVAPRLQLGYQRGFVPDLWNGLANVLILGGSILVLLWKGSLPVFVLVFGGMPVFTTLCNFITEFAVKSPSLRPRIKLFDLSNGLQLGGLGFLFFVQQCFGLIYYASDNLVIARTMGAESVAKYAIVQRLFSLGLITQYMVTPLWPAIGEARARGDYRWAARATRNAIIGGTLFSVALAGALLVFSRPIIKVWFKVDPGPIDSLRIGFALWVVVAGFIATMNALLNQPEMMKHHLLYFGSGSLVSLALKIVFARHGSLAGVVWGTVIAFGLFYVFPSTRLALRFFSNERAKL